MTLLSDGLSGLVGFLMLAVPLCAFLWVSGRAALVRRSLFRLWPVGLFYAVYVALVSWTQRVSVIRLAYRNGVGLLEVERRLHLAWEAPLSHLRVPGATLYYDWAQVAIVLGVLLYCVVAEGEIFWRVARNSLALIAGVGFLCYWLVPVAPPWVLPELFGIHSAGLRGLTGVGELMGAFPSLHTAWAGWVAMVVWAVVPGRLRWLGYVNLVLTGVVVVITGNHYVLDVVGGELLAWSSCAFVGWWDLRGYSVGALSMRPPRREVAV